MIRLLLTRSRKSLCAFPLALGLLMGTSTAFTQTPLTDGQVVKIDPAAGKITIKHGPLKQFGMVEGMTMVYRAAVPAMRAYEAARSHRKSPSQAYGILH